MRLVIVLALLLVSASRTALSAAAAQPRVVFGDRPVVSDSTLTFPAQTVGTIGSAESVVLTNDGPATVSISRDSLAGPGASAFVKAADGCLGVTLAAGATCAIGYTFVPTAVGVTHATLTVISSTGQPLPPFSLSGTGLAPRASTPPSLSALMLSASAFRPARSGASAISASEPTGTFVIYTDSQVAVADFLVERSVGGRYRKIGGFTHTDAAGTNALRFTGRLGGRALPAGSYRLSVTAHSVGGVSPARDVPFQITG
jgi:hypothetical protein